MKTKIRRWLARGCIALALAASVLVAPTASAAPAPAAMSAALDLPPQVSTYYDHDYTNYMARHLLTYTCDSVGYSWTLDLGPWGEGANISSARFIPRPGEWGNCNYMWVMSGDNYVWGTCINRYSPGIPRFGPGFNDYTKRVGVYLKSTCGPF